MAQKQNYVYGPVPSRRLGRSLGVDIVPFKVCSLDCVYCQLGRTLEKTVERRDFVPIEAVLAELGQVLAGPVEADYISLAGSGEPTLHSRLGELIDGVKKLTDIPVAVLTNGTLFYLADVRADCAKADVVMPSLDAADEETFQRINGPCEGIDVEKVISGLCAFREEFAGQIWLEVFFVENINTGREQIEAIKDAIKRIRPDRVHLNTAVRPTADPTVRRVDTETLERIASLLGPRCEVVADPAPVHHEALAQETAQAAVSPAPADSVPQTLLSMLKRRPCSLDDIRRSLSLSEDDALKHIAELESRGLIRSEDKGTSTFYRA